MKRSDIPERRAGRRDRRKPHRTKSGQRQPVPELPKIPFLSADPQNVIFNAIVEVAVPMPPAGTSFNGLCQPAIRHVTLRQFGRGCIRESCADASTLIHDKLVCRSNTSCTRLQISSIFNPHILRVQMADGSILLRAPFQCCRLPHWEKFARFKIAFRNFLLQALPRNGSAIAIRATRAAPTLAELEQRQLEDRPEALDLPNHTRCEIRSRSRRRRGAGGDERG